MSDPLISVVIPVYNAESYIEETLESVRLQTFESFEVLMVDHACTDGSPLILQSYVERDPRFRVLKLDINKGGPAYPRNIGVKEAKGRYIAFLDADDLWDSKKLAKQIDFISRGNLKFTSTSAVYIDENSTPIVMPLRFYRKQRKIGRRTAGDLIKNSFIYTSSVLVAKEMLADFREESEFIAVEDFRQWLGILAQSTAVYAYQDEPLLKYRILEKSTTDRSRLLRQEIKANRAIADFLLDHEEYLSCWYKRLYSHLIKKHILIFLKSKLKK